VSQTFTFESYQKLAARTADPHRYGTERIHVAALGLASEAGEVAGTIKKAAERHQDIDGIYLHRLVEELGDCCWYLAELCSALGVDLADVAIRNVSKLSARYPDGFTPAGSIAKADRAKHGGEHATR